MSFGSVRSLVGISFHSFAPITEKDFRLISGLILLRKIVSDLRDYIRTVWNVLEYLISFESQRPSNSVLNRLRIFTVYGFLLLCFFI